MPLKPTDTNATTGLDTLTDIIREALSAIAGEKMSFVLVAVPRKEPDDSAIIPAMISTNIPPHAVSALLELVAGILDKTPEDQIVRTTANTH